MVLFLQQVFSLLTTSPGNLAYHLVLAFSVTGALQSSLIQWRRTEQRAARRTVLGLAGILILRLLLFGASALAWQNIFSPQILPPLDRGVSLLSLLIIVWMWAFPEPGRLADAASLLTGLLALTYLALALIWWSGQPEGTNFNATWIDIAGESLALLILLLGVLLLLVRRTAAWGLGLGMFTLFFLGHLAHLLAPIASSSFPGAVRLAQMAAYPLLLALPYRFPLLLPGITSAAANPSQKTEEEAGLLPVLFSLAAEDKLDSLCQRLTLTVGAFLQADVVLMITPADDGEQLIVRCGYDLVREENLPGFALEEHLAPSLRAAIRQGRSLHLPDGAETEEMHALAETLGFSRIGHLQAVPLNPASLPGYGLVLLSPYSNRGWNSEDQTSLSEIASSAAALIKNSRQTNRTRQELYQIQESLQAARRQVDNLRSENETLLSQVSKAREEAAQEHHRAESLAAMIAAQGETRSTAAPPTQAEAGLSSKTGLLRDKTSTEDFAHLEGELRLALEEVARLNSLLSEADRQLVDLKTQMEKAPAASAQERSSISTEQAETIATLSEELRQPMSSVIGYTDLLLGESMGILGAAQKKFLERIRASTERMGVLVEDLQAILLANGRVKLNSAKVEISPLIDDAIALAIEHLREKKITLRVDLPDLIPPVRADRDAVQQILFHLLNNAGAVSPVEGQIHLRAAVQEEGKQQDYVLIQVADTGGGIAVDDLPRVFSRLYRSGKSEIKGIGDTGISLSIVKSLVESAGGRIWVDTEMNVGSTFSVLLPVANSERLPGFPEGHRT